MSARRRHGRGQPMAVRVQRVGFWRRHTKWRWKKTGGRRSRTHSSPEQVGRNPPPRPAGLGPARNIGGLVGHSQRAGLMSARRRHGRGQPMAVRVQRVGFWRRHTKWRRKKTSGWRSRSRSKPINWAVTNHHAQLDSGQRVGFWRRHRKWRRKKTGGRRSRTHSSPD